MPFNPFLYPTKKCQQDNPYDTSSALGRIGAGVAKDNNMADKILGYEGTGRAGAAIQKINYKPPVYAPIHVFTIKDVSVAKNEFDAWLIDISGGYVDYQKFMSVAGSLPVLGNVFSLVSALSDIVTLVKSTEAREDVFNWVDLGIDVMGVVPLPGTAAARTSLRPCMGAVRSALKRGVKDIGDALLDALIESFTSHLTAEFQVLIEEAETKIDGFLQDVAKKITEVMNNIAKALTRLLIKGEVFDVGNNYYTAASASSISKSQGRNRAYRPTKVENNGWTYLYNVVTHKAKEVANLAAKTVVGILGEEFRAKLTGQINILTALGAMAAEKITKFAAKHIKDFIKILIRAVKKKLGNKAAVVPARTIGTGKGNTTPNTVEKLPAVTNADGMANCKNGTCPGNGRDINFAMGTERIYHADFTVGGILPIEWLRTYSSAFGAYDDSALGARWTTEYMTRLIIENNEVVFYAEDGRQHRYPLNAINKAHYNLIENHTLIRLSDSLFTLMHGKDRLETFESESTNTSLFRLTSVTIKNLGTVGLRYDHTINGKTILSDVITKQGDKIDAHIRTQIDDKGKINAIWEVKDGVLHRQLAHYQYDDQNDLRLAQDQNSSHWQYEYNHHLVTRYTDRTGRGINIRYDGTAPNSKAVHEWADDGSFETHLEYVAGSRLTIVTEATGDATWHWYDGLGYTYRIIYPDNNEEWFFRNEAKDITKHVHPDGNSDHYVYDESSNLIRHTRPDGSTVHFEYDDADQLTGIADGEGNIWKRDYDQRGNLTEEIDPLGHKTEYQYNKQNLPILITDAKGGEKKLAYTAQGQLASFTDCSGKTTTWTYDNRGRLIKQINAAGETTSYTYTHSGRNAGHLESITHPDETVERFMHDAEGRLLTHTDPRDRQTNYRYSIAGLVAERIDAAGNELTYTYDKLGRLIRLDNENNKAYHFKYDPVGRLLEEIGFDGKATQYQYGTGNGVLERMSDGNTLTAFEFDPMGRLNSRTMATLNEQRDITAKQTETFDYDGNGRLIMATNPASKLQWFYDDAGNLEREHQDYKLQGAAHTAIWRHAYDPLGNRVKTIRPDGHSIELMTYGSGHVHGVLLDNVEAIAFERDDLHREVTRNQANRLNQMQSYDPAGRLKEQLIAYDEALGKTSPFNQRHYSYDKAGQLTNIADQRRGGLSYRYDPIGRLLEASSGLGKELFAFDPAGNVQPVQPSTANEQPNQPHSSKPPANWTKPASILDNLMRDYVGTHYEYDERGNMVKRIHNGETTLFKWDAANRMIESVSTEIKTTYLYDALGRRIVKHSEPIVQTSGDAGSGYLAIQKQRIAQQHNLGLTLYGWDGDTVAWESTYGNRQQVNEQTGQLEVAFDTSRTTHYIYEPNSFVPMMQAVKQGSIHLLPTPDYATMINSPEGYDIDRDPVWSYQAENYVQQFDQVAFYQCDHLGTPQELTDMNGEAVWTAQYKAWGEAKTALTDAAKRAGFTNPIRFQGQYFDHETGLHYNRHRYYDPHSGRFVSRDPIGLRGGFNLHQYVQNPISWIDPLGKQSCSIQGIHDDNVTKGVHMDVMVGTKKVELSPVPDHTGGIKFKPVFNNVSDAVNQKAIQQANDWVKNPVNRAGLMSNAVKTLDFLKGKVKCGGAVGKMAQGKMVETSFLIKALVKMGVNQ